MPPDFPITEEIGKLKEEHGQAGNIKSKSTRLNVQGAIDRIIQYLGSTRSRRRTASRYSRATYRAYSRTLT